MISDRDGSPSRRYAVESCGPLAGDDDHENDRLSGIVLSDGASFYDFYRENWGHFCVCHNSCSIFGSMYGSNNYSSGCSN